MIKAVGNHVLVRQTMTAEKKSSLIMPGGAKDETPYKVTYEILGIGDGELCKNTSLKVGDNILFDRNSQAAYMEEIERKQGELVILEGLFFINDIVGKVEK